MRDYRLSPSSLALYTECPHCFWLQMVKRVKRPDTPFPSLPSGVDKLLKEHFDRYRKMGKLPPELERHHITAKLFKDKVLLDEWRNYPGGKGLQWEDRKSGVVLRGYVDEILQTSGKLIVLDFKTRGFPIKEDTAQYYQDQMDLYNFLLRNNGYDTEDFAYLLFFHPSNVDMDGDFVFETELQEIKVNVDHARRLFLDAIKVLSEKTPPDSSKECGFCRWAGERY